MNPQRGSSEQSPAEAGERQYPGDPDFPAPEADAERVRVPAQRPARKRVTKATPVGPRSAESLARPVDESAPPTSAPPTSAPPTSAPPSSAPSGTEPAVEGAAPPDSPPDHGDPSRHLSESTDALLFLTEPAEPRRYRPEPNEAPRYRPEPPDALRYRPDPVDAPRYRPELGEPMDRGTPRRTAAHGQAALGPGVYRSRRPAIVVLLVLVVIAAELPALQLVATGSTRHVAAMTISGIFLALGLPLFGVGLYALLTGAATAFGSRPWVGWLRNPLACLPVGLVLFLAAALAVR